MRQGLRRICRAVWMALAWALLWAPLGALTGVMVDPDGSMDEPWVAIGAYAGFLCGLVFSAVLGITDRHRPFSELSRSRAGVVGALAGPLVMMLPLSGAFGTPNTGHPLWCWRFVMMAAVALLSSMTAFGSVVLWRALKGRELGEGNADTA